MNGQLVPPEMFLLDPWWRNFGYNMAAVQFVHRGFFWLLLLVIPYACWKSKFSLPAKVLLGAFALQASLGIATLLTKVPVALAATHQAGAVLLLAAALWFAHATPPRGAQARSGE
jgi:cytochrome c oxidase assembly protein subunit 15